MPESAPRRSFSISGAPAAFWAALAPYVDLVLLLPRVHRGLAILLALGVVLGTVLPIAITLAVGRLIVTVPALIEGGSGSDAARTSVAWLLVAGGLMLVMQAVFRTLGAIAYSLGLRLNQHLGLRVMRALNRPFGIAHLEDPATQDLVRRTQSLSEIEGYSPGAAVAALAFQVASWLTSIGYIVVLARFHAGLAVGLFGVAVLASHIQRRDYLRVTDIVFRQTGMVRRADYWRDLSLRPWAAKEIRVWGLGSWLVDRFSGEWRRVMEPAWAERSRGTGVFALAAIAMFAASLFVLVAIALAGYRAEIGLDELMVYALAVSGVGSLLSRGNHDYLLANGTDALPAVRELERLAEASEHDDASDRVPTAGGPPAPGLASSEMPAREISLEGVTFRYPGSDSEVFSDLDLTIEAGRSLAVVGANGAGKTTLVKLIARLYEPNEGRILVDGVDVRELDPRAWQRRVSAIFQDFARYELSARDNVTLGAVERAGDEAALIEAAEMIEALPHGWETRLSRQYRDGAEVSDGQWQRLALARALFAASGGAGVLVLDEPTAHLDVRAEAELYDQFLEITRGLTTILISHRFSTVRRADRIVVLEAGRVIEDGTHEALLAAGGRYAEMFNVQASRFVEDPVHA